MTPATYLIGEGTENQEKFNAKGQQSVYKKILFQNIQEQNQLVKNNKSLIHKNRESLKRRIWPRGSNADTHTACSQKQSIAPKIVLQRLFQMVVLFFFFCIANMFILNLTS